MLIRCCVFLRYSRIIWHSHTLQREKQEVNKNNRQISQIYISTVITYNQRNSIETSLGLLLQVYTKIFVLNAKKKNETVNIGNFLSIKSFFTTINFHTFLFQNIQWYFIICVLSCQQKRKKKYIKAPLEHSISFEHKHLLSRGKSQTSCMTKQHLTWIRFFFIYLFFARLIKIALMKNNYMTLLQQYFCKN